MWMLFKSRKALACLPGVCLLAAAIHSALHSDLKITPKYDDSTVEVALIEPEAPPPPPEPVAEVAPPPPPPPEEVAEAIEQAPPPPPKPKVQVPKPVPVKPKPVVAKAAPVKPAVSAPVPAPPAPVATPAPPAPVVAAKPAAPPASNPDVENRYIARLLAELEKYKQYPRGREASLQRPEGNVVVWLEIDRSGKVLDSGIEKKATNMLLNRAAQTSLSRLEQVVPFPEHSFSGKDKYRFSATLVYNLDN
ncbi:MAG: energy transducer TonB [Pseudomonas sp.]|nr:energy transducer TonB [Pseudomonas sp.]